MEDNKAFAEKYDFNFDLLSDVDKKVGIAYGAADDSSTKTAKRVSALIDENGTVVKFYPKVTPATHPAEVLEDLKALGA